MYRSAAASAPVILIWRRWLEGRLHRVDTLVRSVGLALRLPFFVLGSIGMTVYTLGFGAMSALWFFVVTPILWALLGVPAAFLSVSFRGKGTAELKTRIDSDVETWRVEYTDHFRHFADGYGALTRWVITGSTAKSP
jgi:hypothetical protein